MLPESFNNHYRKLEDVHKNNTQQKTAKNFTTFMRRLNQKSRHCLFSKSKQYFKSNALLKYLS